VPRQNRRRDEPARPSAFAAAHRIDTWLGEDYAVRTVSGAAAVKAYRCPGCLQLVPVGISHVVVWLNADADAAGRRHWHTTCWAARDRRAPGGRR
jgi:hypothetical protein